MTPVKLTPSEMKSQARVDEMLDTALRVKGFGFAEVTNAVLQSRRAMMIFGGNRTAEARLEMARCLMAAVASLAVAHKIGPALFAEAIAHGRVIFRESIRR